MPYFEKDRVTHSIKTGLACLIGFAITKSVHFPVDQWLIITILVVMCAQLNVGSMIQKSYMRFMGTLLGSLVAALTLITLGTNTIVTGIVITLSAVFFSYISTSKASINESGTLGAVTIAIILVGQNPTWLTAFERFIEISIGIFIAAVVSQFVLPIHARGILRRRQALTLRQLRAYYLATLLTEQHDNNKSNYHEIDATIIKSLIEQRKLASEAEREPFAKKTYIVKQFSNLLWCEREMLRSITFMHHTYRSSPETKKIFSNMIILNEFHDKICQALEQMSAHIYKKSSQQINIDLPSIQPIKDAMSAAKQNMSAYDITCSNTFLFCAEILVGRMRDLANFARN
jgi:uncharacterized membrane protein YccC